MIDAFPGARRARLLVEGGGVAPQPLRGIVVFVSEKDAEQRDTFSALLRGAGLLLARAQLKATLWAALSLPTPVIAGATLANTLRGATVCVGAHAPRRHAPRVPSRAAVAVRPEWLFDSIMEGEACGLDAYSHIVPVA